MVTVTERWAHEEQHLLLNVNYMTVIAQMLNQTYAHYIIHCGVTVVFLEDLRAGAHLHSID
jgi:hypothetical protein